MKSREGGIDPDSVSGSIKNLQSLPDDNNQRTESADVSKFKRFHSYRFVKTNLRRQGYYTRVTFASEVSCTLNRFSNTSDV